MTKRKSKIRVIIPKRKLIIDKPKPDCPNCNEGVLELREYIEVATDKWDEEREMVLHCPACGWKS